MPQPSFPPTPGASTDIRGKEHTTSAQLEQPFSLPPSALPSKTRDPSTEGKYNEFPPSPTSPAGRSPDQASTGRKRGPPEPTELTLPPPPTRSRKIIQMKPRNQQSKRAEAEESKAAAAAAKTESTNTNAAGKKKQGGGTSAGRKIARKTAHSLIERRRRSKMNEEFSVLKNMIPACAGQEMHKLAILQASIEYLRYLEQCVDELKAGRNHRNDSPTSSYPSSYPNTARQTPAEQLDSEDESDEEMEDHDDTARPPPINTQVSPTSMAPASALTSPQFSALSTSDRPGSHTGLPSPAFLAQPPYSRMSYQSTLSPHSVAAVHSTQTSPMMLPQSRESISSSTSDHEASAALLMLNATDRRNTLPPVSSMRSTISSQTPSGGRGLSVKDLLHH